MSQSSRNQAINVRYSTLAESSCCLSCGGAVQHAKGRFGEVCVDLGSGRGNDVLRLADAVGEKGFVYGIDLSQGMLEKARRTARRLGVENVRFIRAELDSLPLDRESVDLVISNCTINHASDKQAVWDEVYRILKKGGRFVVSDIYSTAPVPRQYREDPQAVAQCWGGAVTREAYLRQLAAAGFREVEVMEESEPYAKGAIQVASWTIAGARPADCCCSGPC